MYLVIEPQGQIRCLYEEVLDFASLGITSITRASHVEPDNHGRWWADLSPTHGPVLGPFSCRSEALRAEKTWLETHWLARPHDVPRSTPDHD